MHACMHACMPRGGAHPYIHPWFRHPPASADMTSTSRHPAASPHPHPWLSHPYFLRFSVLPPVWHDAVHACLQVTASISDGHLQHQRLHPPPPPPFFSSLPAGCPNRQPKPLYRILEIHVGARAWRKRVVAESCSRVVSGAGSLAAQALELYLSYCLTCDRHIPTLPNSTYKAFQRASPGPL